MDISMQSAVISPRSRQQSAWEWVNCSAWRHQCQPFYTDRSDHPRTMSDAMNNTGDCMKVTATRAMIAQAAEFPG